MSRKETISMLGLATLRKGDWRHGSIPSMTREPINVEGAPPAVVPYSHAVKTEGTLHFCSGQIPLTPEGQLIAGPVAAQTEQVFA
ncbi:Rid family hydrolase, partial [Acinetobacter baumannii]